jgi:uncharacterized protein YceH (UPF0502 family)
MPTELTVNEARVIGCLMEKSVITPDLYPMTLNALTNACNQKSSREPVMSLDPGVVRATIRSLESKHLVRVEENFRTRVEKFSQRLCNTPFSDYQLDPAQFAAICVLLLRGPRTPGEIRANSGRLHTFADNAEVVTTLESLIDREGGALVVELPRNPRRRDPEFAHLLSGPVAVTEHAREDPPRPATPPGREGAAPQQRHAEVSPRVDLTARVEALEEEVAELKRRLAALDG